MELGNLSEITGALTAVAAFIAAVAAARYAKGQLESSNEQLLEVQKQVQIEIERDKKVKNANAGNMLLKSQLG